MRLTLFKKGDFNEVKEKVLKHSNNDIVLKYNSYGVKGLVVVTPYCTYQFVQDGDEIYINIYVSKKMLFDALRQLHEIYEINIYDYEVQSIRGDVL
jgi:hypothetical protein